MQRSRALGALLAVLASVAAAGATSASATTAAPAGHVSDYETYTTVSSTPVYAKPGGSSANQFLFAITPKGQAVDITCWRNGSSVGGDRVWYRMYWTSSTYLVEGYAPGHDVATGSDPNPRIAPC